MMVEIFLQIFIVEPHYYVDEYG